MQLRALDIFCGAGGSSHGAHRAGAEIVCGVDAWKLATDTFKANFPDARVFASKLEDMAPLQLRRAIGSIDLLLASPECTNHTCAKGSARRSELSRETAFQVVRFADAFQPRWIIVENVVQMRRWRRYGSFLRAIETVGYEHQELVLNAMDFATPQQRKRLFLVFSRAGERKELKLVPARRMCTVGDILDEPGKWQLTPLFREGRAIDTVGRYLNGLEQVGPRKPFLLVYYGTDGGGGWQPLDRPLRTVTTVDRFALIDQSGDEPRMRMLQVSELQRAMGFASKYQLPYGTRRDRIKLLGNAVCPPLMAAIVQALTNIVRMPRESSSSRRGEVILAEGRCNSARVRGA